MARVLLLLVLLVANYFFMLVRHEASHAVVAVADGAQIIDFHVWPPSGWNLSWLTSFSQAPRSAASLRAQAAAPYVAALLILFASLWWLARARRRDFLAMNVVLTGVVFTLADLGLAAAGYWFADNDLAYLLGPGTRGSRAFASAWVVVLVGMSAVVLGYHVCDRSVRRPEEGP